MRARFQLLVSCGPPYMREPVSADAKVAQLIAEVQKKGCSEG